MPNRNYLRGRRFEYERQASWRAQGYIVLRTAGSKGPFDLIAVRSGSIPIFIQCKSVSRLCEAARLIRDFRASPSLQPSGHYRQALEVKVVGSSNVDQVFLPDLD
jgi:hypothetical protein